jgi:hypothetical protein
LFTLTAGKAEAIPAGDGIVVLSSLKNKLNVTATVTANNNTNQLYLTAARVLFVKTMMITAHSEATTPIHNE